MQSRTTIKGFVGEVLRHSLMSGCVLHTAMCYLGKSYVPQLVGKGKPDHRVQGEPDLTERVVQGDLEAEGWREPSLDSIMADFIYLDAAVDGESVEGDFMAPVRVRGRRNRQGDGSSKHPIFNPTLIHSPQILCLRWKKAIPAPNSGSEGDSGWLTLGFVETLAHPVPRLLLCAFRYPCLLNRG